MESSLDKDCSSPGISPTTQHKKYPPSELIRERLLSTTERLALPCTTKVEIISFDNIVDQPPNQRDFRVPLDEPLFKPLPTQIHLQNFKPFQSYDVLISFRNMDKFARKIKIEPIHSDSLSIRGWRSESLNSGRVASGMEVPYILKFTPLEDKDYFYNLVCVTERERFIVPIIATGSRGLLDFPDEVHFGECPVRAEATRTILVRNIGKKDTKFELQCKQPFSVYPQQGFLKVLESAQVDIVFNPLLSCNYNSQMEIKYETGEESFVKLNGIGEDIYVKLEIQKLELPPTYITLASSKVIRIINKSDIMAKFVWKMYQSEKEEIQARQLRKLQIMYEEKAEKELVKTQQGDSGNLRLVEKKYENMGKKIDSDSLTNNSIFHLVPSEGVIWPNSVTEVNVMFNPSKMGTHKCTFYCEITGRESRMPLQIKGDAIGPNAQLSVEILDVGDVFVHTFHQYEILIENLGEIEVKFSQIPLKSMFAEKFVFSPSSGILPVNQSQKINVSFSSDILGEVDEVFVWEIEGTTDPLALHVKGRVTGPNFCFDLTAIDFGTVSYDFPVVKEVTLSNTSSIPMDYLLYLDQQSDLKTGELNIMPKEGHLDPHTSEVISVVFSPKSLQNLRSNILVDVLNVGVELKSLPILAKVIVPEIVVQLPVVDFGNCYLGHLYHKTFILTNDTKYDAKFVLIKQDDAARSAFAYSFDEGEGIVNARSTKTIDLAVEIKRLGQIGFPVFAKICGRDELPIAVDVIARGIGPKVSLSTLELNWGKIPVLEKKVLWLDLTNESLVSAQFECQIMSSNSVFQAGVNSGTIKPGQTMRVFVEAFLDDTVSFSDVLKVAINLGVINDITLIAKGFGSTVRIEDSVQNIDFEEVFTNIEYKKVFNIVNHGRRAQTLMWVTDERKNTGMAKGASKVQLSDDDGPVFKTIPPRSVLGPGETQKIEILGCSSKAKQVQETISCFAYIEKAPTKRLILQAQLNARFVEPILWLSSKELNFTFNVYECQDTATLTQNVVLKNITNLPVQFTIRCSAPFKVLNQKKELVELLPSESTSVAVSFLPQNLKECLCRKEMGKVIISYPGHPQKEIIPLTGDLIFPNIQFDKSSVDFGTVFAGTDVFQNINITNSSSLPVEYYWSLDPLECTDDRDSIQELFDLAPISGTLVAGQSQITKLFFAPPYSGVFNAKARCNVIGGPSYELCLAGSSYPAAYTVDKTCLDFGKSSFHEVVSQSITLYNQSDLPLEYSFTIDDKNSLMQRICLYPSTGSLGPKSKELIFVKLCPLQVGNICEKLTLKVGYFEPINITIKAIGYAPQIKLDLEEDYSMVQSALCSLSQIVLPEISKNVKAQYSEFASVIDSACAQRNGQRNMKQLKEEFLLDSLFNKMASLLKENQLSSTRRKRPDSTSNYLGSPILFERFAQKSSARGPMHPIISELTEVDSTQYILNFGNIIKGQFPRKLIHVTNVSDTPISFHMEMNNSVPFISFGTEKIKNLLPQESATVEVKINTKLVGDSENIEIPIWLSVFSGFRTRIRVLASVIMPDIQLTHTKVDFGQVFVGQRKTIFVQILNTKPVLCEWSTPKRILNLLDNASTKGGEEELALNDSTVLKIEPRSGVLNPEEKSIIGIQFEPLADVPYRFEVPIQLSSGQKKHAKIEISGIGAVVSLILEPNVLTLGPILPYSECVEGKFTVKNPMEFPIEIFAMDYDSQFKDEKESLRALLLGSSNGSRATTAASSDIQMNDIPKNLRLYCPPRFPGEQLSAQMIRYICQTSSRTQPQFDRAATPKICIPDYEQSMTVLDDERKPSTASDTLSHRIFMIIHGSPLAGKTMCAQRVASMFRVPCLRLDEFCNEDIKGSRKRATTKESRSSHLDLTQTDTVKKSEFTIHKVSPKQDMDLLSEKMPLNDDAIIEAIKTRLDQPDCHRGFVIDGLDSRYFSNTATIVRGIVEFLGPANHLHFFFIHMDAQQVKERELIKEKQLRLKKRRIQNAINEIDEHVYDNLDAKSKEFYDDVAKSLRKVRKSIIQKLRQSEDKYLSTEGKSERKYLDDTLQSKVKAREHLLRTKKNLGVKEKEHFSKLSAKKERTEEDTLMASRPEFSIDKLDTTLVAFQELSIAAQQEIYNNGLVQLLQIFRDQIERVPGPTLRQIALNTFVQDTNKKSKKNANLATNAESAANASVQIAADCVSCWIDGGAIVEFHELSPYDVHAKDDYLERLSDLTEEVFEKWPLEQIMHYLPAPHTGSDLDNEAERTYSEMKLEHVLDWTNMRCINSTAFRDNLKLFYLTPSALTEEESIIGNNDPQFAVTNSSLNLTQQNYHNLSSSTNRLSKTVEEDRSESPPSHMVRGSYRWILQPKETKELVVKFAAMQLGSFEHVIRFKILGFHDIVELKCFAACRYANIVTDSKRLFRNVKAQLEDKTLQSAGEFIQTLQTYDFGPLLGGKPKEKASENKNIENRLTIPIVNASPFDTKVYFFSKSFDSLKGSSLDSAFTIEPAFLDLTPNQSGTLHISAYPKNVGRFEDTVIFCVKDNPEPYFFKVVCHGCKPEMEIDKRVVQFDRLLLGRVDSKEMKLLNKSQLPISWKLSGLDGLAEDFDITPVEGLIAPLESIPVHIKFQSLKPGFNKKSLKIEVSDPDRLTGVSQTENITIIAEAYDVSIDIHFPRSVEGGLDFGTVRVDEESKHTCLMRNKGKYDVGYRFEFGESKEIHDCITVSPLNGFVPPSEKPTVVQIVFKSNYESIIKENTSVRLVIIEPATNEVIGGVPLKISARSLYSRFILSPARDLSFGALLSGTRCAKTFAIENTGEFDFKFNLFKADKSSLEGKTSTGRSRESRAVNRRDLKLPDTLLVGPFSIFPTSGTVSAESKAIITIEFHADTVDSFEEIIDIDISDRSPKENGEIEYRISGETCLPGINVSEYSSIFEENTVMKRGDSISSVKNSNLVSNVFFEDERSFHFGPLLIGQQAQVRFKISNPFKIACECTLATKPRFNKSLAKGENEFPFEVEPKKISLPPHEHRFVTVTFHPTSLAAFTGLFEAISDPVQTSTNVPVNDINKNRTLSFELRGDGTLPRITIEKPSFKNKLGLPLLRFRKVFCGCSQVLQVVLKNEGFIPAKVKLDWNNVKDSNDFECRAVDALLHIDPHESHSFDVRFKPSLVKKCEAELKLRVLDNSFEDTSIFIQGEGYMDQVTFSGFTGEADNEHLSFGGCRVGEQKTVSFFATNNSTKDMVKLHWATLGNTEFVFSPEVMHLSPQATKEIMVSLYPKSPSSDNISGNAICKISRIMYMGPLSSLIGTGDWDDRLKVMRWQADEKSHSSKKVLEPCPEPSFEVVGTLPEQTLLLTAFSDYIGFECEQGDVTFKVTLMFQSRTYKFPLRNTGRVPLQYTFQLENAKFLEPSPFSVQPTSGIIDPNDSVIITLRFSPLTVGEFTQKLSCIMPGLQPNTNPLAFKLSGSSMRPLCHFELPDSDYFVTKRKHSDSNAGIQDLDPSTKVIEFDSCGINVRNVKKFYIVNPTDEQYDFEWTCLDNYSPSQVFRCETTKGLVAEGKKFEMVFEYLPESIEVKESLWKFSLPKHNISVPFLLVGCASEPNVYFNKASINFKTVLVGRQLKETIKLVNMEKVPFTYMLDLSNLVAAERDSPILSFAPSNGTVAASSETVITITFKPTTERNFNYNLVCNVKRKPIPLVVNIKGEGYEIHEKISSEMADSSMFELASGTDVENVLDFGEIQVNERRSKKVVVENVGKVNLDFRWQFVTRNNPFISISPEFGSVAKGESLTCEIVFFPTSTIQLKPAKLSCVITNGRTYPITLMGMGRKPLLKLSTYDHDFGERFIVTDDMQPIESIVTVRNDDVRDLAFAVIPLESKIFDVSCGNNYLVPGEVAEIGIKFLPKEQKQYKEIVQLEVNGLSKIDLILRGIGADFKIEVLKPEMRHINFGALRIGSHAHKTVILANRSSIAARFSLGPPGVFKRLSYNFIECSSQEEYYVKPKSTVSVDFQFDPKSRRQPFTEEIFLCSPGVQRPLFLVSGASQGIDIKLESEVVSFGAVVHRSSASRKLQLINCGDVGVRFRWDQSQFGPDFSISPYEGYLSPGMDVQLEIVFSPLVVNNDICYENLVCEIEGGRKLYLTLSGSCIVPPLQSEAVKFSVPVRQCDSKSVPIVNKSNNVWQIRPIIENEYFSINLETLILEPYQTKQLDVFYKPLEMSGENNKHEGSIFLPLPDGSGLLYKLIGQSDKPVPEATLNREIPSKVSYWETLKVSNWLKRSQRFKVLFELGKPDPSFIVKGNEFVDVAGLASKEYKVQFYAYREGTYSLKVIFKNESTQEYIFYVINIKTLASGILGILEISSPVRRMISRDVVISNPLPTPVSFTTSINHPEVTIPHSLSVQPKSEACLTVDFLPLQVRDSMARLVVSNTDLGTYQYDLKLVATAAQPEKSLHFKVLLGGYQTQTLRFISYSKTKTEYTCRLDSSDFTAEKTVVVPAAVSGGVEASVDITYEPSKLGAVRSVLYISSSSAGDYICPLIGHCSAPRPQGPIILKAGMNSINLQFKNVFTTNANFNFTIDNPQFIVKPTENIPAKKTVTVTITYKPNASPNKNAKLVITHPSGTSWIYYVKSVQ